MEFLDLSDTGASTVIINFPGRPRSANEETQSHIGQDGKYNIVGERVRDLGIGFIGCQQMYDSSRIVTHTHACLHTLEKYTRDRMVLLVGSSAGAGGILASTLARKIATGMILLNANPYNAGKDIVEMGLEEFPRWVDFYNGFEDTPTHATWAERIAKEARTTKRSHERIDGQHSLTADQVFNGILMSLRRRNFLE